MAAEGMTNRDIAQALFVTTKTVENQLGRICRKLGSDGRQRLAGALEDDVSRVRVQPPNLTLGVRLPLQDRGLWDK